MNPTFADVSKRLLSLASKAAAGQQWSSEEQANVDKWLNTDGDVGILAACCVLASKRPPGCPQALRKVRLTLARAGLPVYLELCVYEALAFVETPVVMDWHEDILGFIRRSLLLRRIDLTNTIYVLGKLARMNDAEAQQILQMLAQDSDAVTSSCARLMLEGVRGCGTD